MSTNDPEFRRFAQQLDEEWMRTRLRSIAPAALDAEADLAHELERADPLGEPARPGWRDTLRELFAPWPARMSLAGAVCALLVLGFFVGRMSHDPVPGPAIARPALPAWDRTGSEAPRLGIGPAIAPASERKFREAMTFHGTPDFPVRAVPLLREAVALDGSNDLAHFWLGVALLVDGKPEPATPHLEKAQELAPASLPYKRYLLFAYLQAGDLGKARALQADLLRRETGP